MELQFDNEKLMSDEQIVELYWQRDERAIDQTDRKYKKFLLFGGVLWVGKNNMEKAVNGCGGFGGCGACFWPCLYFGRL